MATPFFLREGKVTAVPCFSDNEVLDFPEPIGRLEAFVTSGGLSTSPWTFEGRLKRLENKTLRYPGTWPSSRRSRISACSPRSESTSAAGQSSRAEVLHALLGPRICRNEVKDVCVMRVKGTGTTKAGAPRR